MRTFLKLVRFELNYTLENFRLVFLINNIYSHHMYLHATNAKANEYYNVYIYHAYYIFVRVHAMYVCVCVFMLSYIHWKYQHRCQRS